MWNSKQDQELEEGIDYKGSKGRIYFFQEMEKFCVQTVKTVVTWLYIFIKTP
jgi:hypothetical protein